MLIKCQYSSLHLLPSAINHPLQTVTKVQIITSVAICHNSPITDGHQMSVHIITSVAICHNSPITDAHQMSVHIFTSVAICHNSPITDGHQTPVHIITSVITHPLHYNIILFLKKEKIFTLNIPVSLSHNIYQYFQSQTTRTLRTILSP